MFVDLTILLLLIFRKFVSHSLKDLHTFAEIDYSILDHGGLFYGRSGYSVSGVSRI